MAEKSRTDRAVYWLTHPVAAFSAVFGVVLSAPDVLAGAVSGVGTMLLGAAPILGNAYALGGILMQLTGLLPGLPVGLIQMAFAAVAVLYAAVYVYRAARKADLT